MEFRQIELGSHKVEVMAGGYYDRYRMNPDLDEIAGDPGIGSLDWFRRFPKRIAPSGLGPMWTPNFYYRSSSLQLLFLAPLNRLRPAGEWWPFLSSATRCATMMPMTRRP